MDNEGAGADTGLPITSMQDKLCTLNEYARTCDPMHTTCPICSGVVNYQLKGMPLGTVNAAQTVVTDPG